MIVSRTLSGLFLVGAVTRSRKTERTDRRNPQKHREDPGTGQGQQKDKSGQTSPNREAPPFEPPSCSGPWNEEMKSGSKIRTTKRSASSQKTVRAKHPYLPKTGPKLYLFMPFSWAELKVGGVGKTYRKAEPREDGPSDRLSGPLRLRLQSRSRTRLRIAASIAFSFRACFKGV